MATHLGVADRLVPLLERVVGASLPIRVRGWDGSESGPTGASTILVRSPRALRRLLWQPNELGLGRACARRSQQAPGDHSDDDDRDHCAADAHGMVAHKSISQRDALHRRDNRRWHRHAPNVVRFGNFGITPLALQSQPPSCAGRARTSALNRIEPGGEGAPSQ